MTAAWSTPDQHVEAAPPPPDPRVGRGPWPLAPLTVPIALVVGTFVAGALAHLVLSELPWSERLDTGGLFTFGVVFGGCLAGVLVLLSLATRARPSIVRALVGTAVTAVGFGVIAVVANEVTEDFGAPDPFLGNRDLFTDDPVRAVIIPYQLMLSTFADLDVLTARWFDSVFVFTVVIAFGILMAVVGAGGTIASGGTVRSALLAAIGAAGGAFVGELFVQYGSFEWPDAFFDGVRGPTLLVLIPIVLSGIGLGLGALLGRPHGPRAAAPLPTGTPPPFGAPQPYPAAPGLPPAAPPPGPVVDGPPPGATPF